MMLQALEGRSVIVTGSTRGLGRAFARELVTQGANVVINGTRADTCAEVAETLGPRAVAVAGSVSDEAVAEALVARCEESFGGVDAVINNAGFVRDAALTRMTAEQFDEVVDVHLRGAWLMSRAAARSLRERGGSILNITSGTGLYGLPGQSNYAAAKGGVLGLTRALSLELGRGGVRVNALAPVALTEMTGAFADPGNPLGERFRPPEEVAPVAAFLVSEAASHLNGQVVTFDGRALTMWSHPVPVASVDRNRIWVAGDFEAALDGSSLPLQTVNPDPLGRAVFASLGLSDWAESRPRSEEPEST